MANGVADEVDEDLNYAAAVAQRAEGVQRLDRNRDLSLGGVGLDQADSLVDQLDQAARGLSILG